MYISNKIFKTFICIMFVPSTVFCKLLFTLTHWNTCLPDQARIKTILRISLSECMVECGKRGSCEYVGYMRNLNLCQLYNGINPEVELEAGTCLLIRREDIDNSMFPADCTCAERQVCSAGICQYEECPNLLLTNGVVMGNINDAGTMLVFHCEAGYKEYEDYRSATCGSYGNWSYTPSCISTIVCDDITINNGVLTGTGNGVGAVRTIICDSGYEEVSSEASIQCKITGDWNYVPTCSLIIVCDDLTISNGVLTGTGNGVGAERTIICDSGYDEVSSETSIHCENTGDWNYIPTCSPIIVCGNLALANGDLIGTGYEVGAERRIECDTGYEEPSGETSIICENSGNWNYIPACKAVNNGCDDSSSSDDCK